MVVSHTQGCKGSVYCPPQSIVDTGSWMVRATCGSQAGDRTVGQRGPKWHAEPPETRRREGRKAGLRFRSDQRKQRRYRGNWRALWGSYIPRSRVVRRDVDGEPMVDWWATAGYVPQAAAWERQPTEAPGAGQLLASASTAARSVGLRFHRGSGSCGPRNKRACKSGLRGRIATGLSWEEKDGAARLREP